MSRETIYSQIDRVRQIQDELYGEINAEYSFDDPRLLTVLLEQIGDVAAMLNYIETSITDEDATDGLREALLHVAACAVLWLEK